MTCRHQRSKPGVLSHRPAVGGQSAQDPARVPTRAARKRVHGARAGL